MVEVFKEDTRLEVWLKASKHLLKLKARKDLNLVLEIANPISDGHDVWQPAMDLLDNFLLKEDALPLNAVAETIFPGSLYKSHGIRGVYEIYPDEIYPVLKQHPKFGWGTYAFRLLRRNKGKEQLINPLEQLIYKMKGEAENPAPKRSCYELGIAEGQYDAPLYDMATDGLKRLGFPCLSHVSFKLFEGRVHLTAIYRSHCYRYKALGNLLGLARLQAFVAEQVEREVGTLVVHSTYAFLDGAKGTMEELLQSLYDLTSKAKTQSGRPKAKPDYPDQG